MTRALGSPALVVSARSRQRRRSEQNAPWPRPTPALPPLVRLDAACVGPRAPTTPTSALSVSAFFKWTGQLPRFGPSQPKVKDNLTGETCSSVRETERKRDKCDFTFCLGVFCKKKGHHLQSTDQSTCHVTIMTGLLIKQGKVITRLILETSVTKVLILDKVYDQGAIPSTNLCSFLD